MREKKVWEVKNGDGIMTYRADNVFFETDKIYFANKMEGNLLGYGPYPGYDIIAVVNKFDYARELNNEENKNQLVSKT